MKSAIGSLVYWTEVADPKGKGGEAFPSRTRCGMVHDADDGGGVSVRLLREVDALCPEAEEGLALSIPAGS